MSLLYPISSPLSPYLAQGLLFLRIPSLCANFQESSHCHPYLLFHVCLLSLFPTVLVFPLSTVSCRYVSSLLRILSLCLPYSLDPLMSMCPPLSPYPVPVSSLFPLSCPCVSSIPYILFLYILYPPCPVPVSPLSPVFCSLLYLLSLCLLYPSISCPPVSSTPVSCPYASSIPRSQSLCLLYPPYPVPVSPLSLHSLSPCLLYPCPHPGLQVWIGMQHIAPHTH